MSESFVFYRSFIDAVETTGLSPEDQLQMLKAIIHYALDSKEPDSSCSVTTKLAFTLIKPQIDANSERRINGSKGGRPKKQKTIGYENSENLKTIGFEKTENSKPNVNVNVNVNENANVNVNEELCAETAQKKTVSKFVKPTVEEVAEYCRQRNNSVDAGAFCDFYESKGWKIGKDTMKDWKAAVRTWERSESKRQAASAPKGTFMSYVPTEEDFASGEFI